MERQGRWMMRFSVRNLVLAITAFAIAWHVFQFHYRPYQLVKDLQECGAEVEFDRENLFWFARCFGSVIPESSVLTVKSVRFRASTQSFDYSRLRQFKLLQKLELIGSYSVNEPFQDLMFLDHLQHIHSLEIFDVSVNAALMETLVRQKPLKTVTFFFCSFEQLDKPPNPEKGTNTKLQTITIAVSRSGTHLIEWLNQFTGLQELRIYSIPLTDDDLDRLAPSPKLTLFEYFVEGGITPDQHQALQEKYPNVHLDVYDIFAKTFLKINDDGSIQILQPEK